MQRRAIRDAKTPEKMKQIKPVVDDSLTLQGKKDKIKSNLQRLAELGKVDPQNRYQELINDIAKVGKSPISTIKPTISSMIELKIVCVTGHPKSETVPSTSES